jgi:hypothetical protein
VPALHDAPTRRPSQRPASSLLHELPQTVRRVQINMSGNKELLQTLQPVYDRWRWHENQADGGPKTKEQFLLEVFEMRPAVQRTILH